MPATLYDVNIWLALTFSAHPFHKQAKTLFSQSTPKAPALFCRATEISFLRLSTTPVLLKAYGCPELTNRDAIGFLARYRRLKRVAFQEEPEKTQDRWLQFANVATTSPKLWMDAYLAAVAVSGDLRFATIDSDFQRFEESGLEVILLGTRQA